MSDHRPSRRSICLAALAALAGCGFQPALGTGGAAAALQGAVVVEAPATPDGFTLSARLQDRFGPLNTARYRLSVTYDTESSAAAINADGDTTRINLRGVSQWQLRDLAGQPLLSGTAQTFVSYSTTGTTVATQAAASDAGRRLATSLADLMVADMTARAGDLP